VNLEFNVVDTEAATLPLIPAKEHVESKNIVIVYATGSAIFLTVLLFVVVSLCFAQRAKFQRQLKAATANSYGKPKFFDFISKKKRPELTNFNHRIKFLLYEPTSNDKRNNSQHKCSFH
jgi:hypothetical protein